MNYHKADVAAIMEYLGSFELNGFNAEERKKYLNFSLDRFLKTIELFPDGIGETSSVLELGASPYFMSLLIRKHFNCQMDFANYFGKERHKGNTEVLISEKYHEKHGISFRHFNVEYDEFPFKKNSYDLVLFCEIIEHLTVDPVHSLVQINRLLKNGGHIIITTPNVLRYENVLKLIAGRNVHDHYSGYGAYGRHNREYTPNELRLLVESLGYRVERLYTKVTGSMHIQGFSIKKFRRLIQFLTTKNRGSNIFLLARKVSDAEYKYPEWLFESMHERAGRKKK
ncbi:MAG: methyltransferase domain-containing protein [Spirochaetes bacterium]|nr:methyltransferase domain-containing protein [Spirochaetota bacterium]